MAASGTSRWTSGPIRRRSDSGSAPNLSDRNGCLLWIPPGFAHGFCVLGDEPADLLYKVDAPYGPGGEGGIAWNDPELAVPWPIDDPIVSDRDRTMQSFASYKANPPRWPSAVPVR